MKFLKNLVLLLPFLSMTTFAAELKVGDKAPAVIGLDQNGKSVDFSEVYKSNKYVLVYFYPKAGTPGCTAQACSLRDAYQVLQKESVFVIGVSADDEKAQKEFEKKYKLPFTLIADNKKKVISAFGVPTTLGFAKRQAFLMKEGTVVWLDREASTKEQADDILKFLKTETKD